MTEHTSPSSDSSVTVDLGQWADDVDAYATRHDLSREAAVLALIRDALTRPHRNHISRAEGGTILQTGDVRGDISL